MNTKPVGFGSLAFFMVEAVMQFFAYTSMVSSHFDGKTDRIPHKMAFAHIGT